MQQHTHYIFISEVPPSSIVQIGPKESAVNHVNRQHFGKRKERAHARKVQRAAKEATRVAQDANRSLSRSASEASQGQAATSRAHSKRGAKRKRPDYRESSGEEDIDLDQDYRQVDSSSDESSSSSDDEEVVMVRAQSRRKKRKQAPGHRLIEEEDDDNVTNFTPPDEPDGIDGEITGDLPEKLKAKNSEWVWRTKPKKLSGKHPAVNSFTEKKGLKPGVRAKLEKVRDAFVLYFPPDLAETILQHTNRYAAELDAEFPDAKYHQVTMNELMSFIGILLTMGARGDTKEHTNELWSKLEGRGFYNVAMGKRRFVALLQMIRFDDHRTSLERKENDRFTLIR